MLELKNEKNNSNESFDNFNDTLTETFDFENINSIKL